MLTHFLRIRDNPLRYLADMQAEYGNVVQFPIPRPPTYLIADAQAARQVLMASPRDYSKQTIQYSALSLVTGNGLLTSDGDTWRRQRRLVQPAFSARAIDRLADHVVRAMQRVDDRWLALPDRGAVIDMDELMMGATMEIVGASLFGADLTADADQLAQATLRALEVVVARARVPITPPAWIPTPANRRLQQAVGELDDLVESIIAARRSRLVDDTDVDMLDLLLAGDESGDVLSVTEVRNQIVTFIVAGHETVASALAWALWCISGDDHVQSRMHDEVDSVVGAGELSMATLADLPYIRAVFEEAMRLFPPAWLVTRKALKDDTLARTNVPAGSLIILSPYLIHRDPQVWNDPHSFVPERFLGIDTRGAATATSYWPFGAGPRLCIGRDFSYAEGVLILAGLVRRARFDREPGQVPPVPLPQVTIRPAGGVRLRVSRRG